MLITKRREEVLPISASEGALQDDLELPGLGWSEKAFQLIGGLVDVEGTESGVITIEQIGYHSGYFPGAELEPHACIHREVPLQLGLAVCLVASEELTAYVTALGAE
jgi:hypothetical protein